MSTWILQNRCAWLFSNLSRENVKYFPLQQPDFGAICPFVHRFLFAIIQSVAGSKTESKEVLAIGTIVIDKVIDGAAVMQSCKQFQPVLPG